MTMEALVQVSQIAAFISAAAFFVYKLFVGYFVPNVSLTPKLTRHQKANGENDLLIIEVELKKGDVGSVNLHDFKARIRCGDELDIVNFIGIERLSFNTDKSSIDNERKCIAWNRVSKKNPLLRLGPGESAVFSTYVEVKSNVVAIVEIVVLGVKPRSWFVSQWRSSAVSIDVCSLEVNNKL